VRFPENLQRLFGVNTTSTVLLTCMGTHRRNKIGKQLKKQQQNVQSLEKEKLIEKIEARRQQREKQEAAARRKKKKLQQGGSAEATAEVANPLGRFKKRRLSTR